MKPIEKVPIGASATKEITVTRDMTVAHFHEHMPEVYGTPIMIYHLEVTAEAAVREFLPEGWITVGSVVNVKHLAATPVGATVTTRAEVTEVGDYTITFKVEATMGSRRSGKGFTFELQSRWRDF